MYWSIYKLSYRYTDDSKIEPDTDSPTEAILKITSWYAGAIVGSILGTILVTKLLKKTIYVRSSYIYTQNNDNLQKQNKKYFFFFSF